MVWGTLGENSEIKWVIEVQNKQKEWFSTYCIKNQSYVLFHFYRYTTDQPQKLQYWSFGWDVWILQEKCGILGSNDEEKGWTFVVEKWFDQKNNQWQLWRIDKIC